MALTWNIKNCIPPTIAPKETGFHEVICKLCALSGVDKITAKNTKEVFRRLKAIEGIQGALLTGPQGNVYLRQEDINRWIGLELNVIPLSGSRFNTMLAEMAVGAARDRQTHNERYAKPAGVVMAGAGEVDPYKG